MPTIATNNEVITVIIIFSVAPSQQQDLIEAIAEFLETVKQQPGFVSSSLHKSLDRLKVSNYAQWQSVEDYEAFLNNLQVPHILHQRSFLVERGCGVSGAGNRKIQSNEQLRDNCSQLHG